MEAVEDMQDVELQSVGDFEEENVSPVYMACYQVNPTPSKYFCHRYSDVISLNPF